MNSEEIRNKEFKSGIGGYKKTEVIEFLAEVSKEYEQLYNENIELKDKVTALSDGLQYYKTIEKTLQKALVLAQKTADENYQSAVKKAESIEKEAQVKAHEVIEVAKKDLDTIYRQADDLNRKFELYKSQIKNLVSTQMELINSDSYNITINDLDGYLKLKESLIVSQIEEKEDSEKEDKKEEDKKQTNEHSLENSTLHTEQDMENTYIDRHISEPEESHTQEAVTTREPKNEEFTYAEEKRQVARPVSKEEPRRQQTRRVQDTTQTIERRVLRQPEIREAHVEVVRDTVVRRQQAPSRVVMDADGNRVISRATQPTTSRMPQQTNPQRVAAPRGTEEIYREQTSSKQSEQPQESGYINEEDIYE